VTDIASHERAAIADLLWKIGPDAPTLCEGWTTRDLAAHLVTRLTRVDAGPGIMIPAFAPYTTKVRDRAAQQAWPTLIAKVRRRPWWIGPLDEPVNATENFIHHEDIRRAQPQWQPRSLPPETAAVLWSRVRRLARLALRKTPAAVTVTAPGFGSVAAGRGGPGVDLSGPPSELLMFLSGRQAHAQIELDGPANITDRMRGAHYGV
jgi:uncharacterized protein (TIGR03085 family)